MNCQEFLAHLPSYPDAVQDQRLLAELRRHAAECPACETLLTQQEKMLADLNCLDDALEVPEAFTKGWRENIRQSTPSGVKKRWHTWAVSAAAALMLLAGTAMMREGIIFETVPEEAVYGYADVAAKYEAEYAYDQAEQQAVTPLMHKAAMTGGGAAPNGAAREAVVLHTASVTIQTEQYDQDIARMEALLGDCGGWTEYQSMYGEALTVPDGTGRNASMTLRVPMDSLDAFLEAANTIGRVTGSEKTAQDITENYYDTKARLTMYEAQRDRLVALLEKAESLSDIIDIESRMNELQYTIESLQGTLNSWNSRAENAIVYISLSEVSRGETKVPSTLSEKLVATIESSIKSAWAFVQDMMVFLIMAAPYLAVLAVIALVVLGIHKKRKNRR